MQNTLVRDANQSQFQPFLLQFVSDDELLEKARELAHHQTELTISTIHHLSEIERRTLYAKRGYPSLFEYVVRELHYSKAGAWRRIMTMKLCREVPGTEAKLRSGELNLTTASQLQNAIEKRARKAARQAAATQASEAGTAVPAEAGSSAGEKIPVAQWGSYNNTAVPAEAGRIAGGTAPTGAAVGGPAPPPSQASAVMPPEPAPAEGTRSAAGGAALTGGAPTGATAGESAAGESAPGVVLRPLEVAAADSVATGSEALVPAPVEAGRLLPESAASGGAAAVSPAGAATQSAGEAQPPAVVAREPAPAPPAVAPTPAWTADQKAELVELVSNKSARETEKLLAELEPELKLPRERERALGGGHYEVRVILDQASVAAIAGFTTGQLLAYLLQQAQRKYDPLRERGTAREGGTAREQSSAVSRGGEPGGGAVATGDPDDGKPAPDAAARRSATAAAAPAGSPTAGPVAASSRAAGVDPGSDAPRAAIIARGRARAAGSPPNHEELPAVDHDRHAGQARCAAVVSAKTRGAPLAADRGGGQIRRAASCSAPNHDPSPAPDGDRDGGPGPTPDARFAAKPRGAAASGRERADSARGVRFTAEPGSASGSGPRRR